ncbi:C4-dicarboxylate ABC transporter substrate-binding protein [Brevibacterium litoralis]|uniref:C4-dicarboxylate ABC transporter substrate-binding protein n=1 Tax=Brevibacterium litoralis TaxID=3138935 RepID=UPI0032EEB774
MNTTQERARKIRAATTTAAGIAVAALLAGCAGGAGGGGNGGGSGSGDGFAYGASQDEVNAAIADLEPVTITFQSGSASELVSSGEQVHEFVELVEERSNGQITVDVAWGMSIAGYTEAVDALADGRVDVSYHLLGYEPQRFPEATDIGTSIASVGFSPLVGEMTAYAVASDLAWNNEAHMQRFEEEGIMPVAPLIASGQYSLNCSNPVTTLEEFQGKQVRAGTVAQGSTVTELGAVPVSMEFTEVFEAMQRGTVDCDLSPMSAKDQTGVYEAAPHLAITTEANFPRFPASYLAGTNVMNMPLAYQQIIFDSAASMLLAGDVQGYVNSNARHVEDIHSVDGSITEFDDEFQQVMGDYVGVLQQEAIDRGTVPEDTPARIDELEQEWQQKIADLGYEDGGDMTTANEWVDRDLDYDPFAWAVFEEAGPLDHRPGN